MNRTLPKLALVAAIMLIAAGCAADDDALLNAGVDPADHVAHQGGAEIIRATTNAGTADPQVNYTPEFWQLYTATNDGLTAFTKTGPNTGSAVVADLATSIPKPTDNGLHWQFTLRAGIRYNDGTPVRAADVKASFERIFKVRGPTGSSMYNVIAGADACLAKPDQCDLSAGIAVDNATNTVTFTLTQADAEFPQKLAMPFATILPANTATSDVGSDVTKLRATGPYYWASYDPTDRVVLRRNPYFRVWSDLAQPIGYPDQIVEEFGLEPTDEITSVLNHQADYVYDPPPPDRLNEISVNHPQQLHLDPQGEIYYWALNTRIPPFNNVKARQALNLAFDRNAAVVNFGGPGLASTSCQVLVPGIPGYQPYCPWTAHPSKDGTGQWHGTDLARAKQLVAESGTAGTPVTVVPGNDPIQLSMGEYMQTVLTQLGYPATLKPLDNGIQYPFVQNSANRVQVGLATWTQDYPAPSDFLNVLLSCAAFVPNSDASPNIGGFCDPAIDKEMNQALSLANTDPDAANALWTKIDRQVTDEAPWVSMITPQAVSFVSSRVGNYTYSAQYGFLPADAWVR